MGAKYPSRPTIFNPYNLGIIINVGISPKNFLNFSFNPFDTVLKNVKAISSGSPTCTWTKSTPPKKLFFWSNPYKIEIMITSLIEMLESRVTKLWSHDHICNIIHVSHVTKFCWWHHGQKLWRHNLYFKMPLF